MSWTVYSNIVVCRSHTPICLTPETIVLFSTFHSSPPLIFLVFELSEVKMAVLAHLWSMTVYILIFLRHFVMWWRELCQTQVSLSTVLSSRFSYDESSLKTLNSERLSLYFLKHRSTYWAQELLFKPSSHWADWWSTNKYAQLSKCQHVPRVQSWEIIFRKNFLTGIWSIIFH